MLIKRSFLQICLLGGTLLASPATLQAQFTYSTSGGKVTITGYTGSGGAVTIPATINSLPVVSIGGGAFENSSVTSVTIPGTVTSIGTNAFLFSTLNSVNIPNGVTFIGDSAFGACQITHVVIPGGVGTIGNSVFGGCGFLTSVTISMGVTNLGDFAFGDCHNLPSITIPTSVTTVGNQTFELCSGLTSVTIPSSVTSIGEGPFDGCSNLKTITVNGSNPDFSSVGGVLFNKSKTWLIQYPGGVGGTYTIPNGVTIIGAQAFDSSFLTAVTLPNSITTIGSGAFAYCGGITGITLPSSLSTLDNDAFNSAGLTSITIPASLTTISEDAFTDCRSLTSVTLPNSVTSIGDNAFSSCVDLTGIAIPSSVTNIGVGAFDGSGLKTFPNFTGVKSIGDAAFGDTPLSSVTIPSSVTSIGDFVFSSCFSLTSVTIPASVTSIGEAPFVDCTSLSAVTVDSSNPAYTMAGGALFDKGKTTLVELLDDTGDTSYTIPAGVTSIAAGAFLDIFNLINITIPEGVISIGTEAFSSCALTNIIIPASVASIGDKAFFECSSLTGVYFSGNAPALGGANVFLFLGANPTAYYVDGTLGWGATYGGLPTALWNSPEQISGITSIGILNNQLGFTINGTNNQVVVVEASTNLINPNWQPIQTNTLNGTSFNFIDAQWRSYPCRFYRIVPMPPVVVPFTYTTSSGTVTITGYTGSNGVVTIPSKIAGVPVTSIGDYAFHLSSVTNVTIPDSVITIGDDAFSDSDLTSITIPASVTSIGDFAFYGCSRLTGAYFQGNAPALVGSGVFSGVHAGAIVYCLGGTKGWNMTYGGLPTAVIPVITGSGVLNNQFGFTINGITNLVIMVEASTNLTNPNWQPIQTNTLSGASFNFTDSQWRNYPRRFYRIVSAPPAAMQTQFTYKTNSGTITITGYAGSGGAIMIPSTITGLPVTSIGDEAFFDISGLTAVTIPNSVTNIGSDAFFDSGLTSVTIPNSVITMGANHYCPV